jgi:hypothetical protein
MFAVMHSDMNSLESGLLYLAGQPYCKKSRSAKVKDGIIINLILRNYLVNQDTQCHMLFIVMMNVIMLSVTMLNVDMMSVMVPITDGMGITLIHSGSLLQKVII